MDALAVELLQIPLTRGFVAIVEAELFEATLTYRFRSGDEIQLRASSVSWCASPNRNYWYATARVRKKTAALHRLLVQAPTHLVVDHRNGDTMDNRLENLRICTHAQNAANSWKYSRGASRFKGVRLRGSKWMAQWHWRENGIQRCRSLGFFETEELAARARDAVAIAEHGEFARLNFPVSP